MIPLDEDFLRLEEWRVTDDVGYGVLVRLRAGKRPTVASKSHDGVRGLTLAEGEELAETAGFAYHVKHGVLAIEHNLDAVGVSNLCWYIHSLCGGADVAASHITSLGDKTIGRVGHIRSAIFKFKIDKPQNLGLYDEPNSSVESIVRLGNEAKAREVTIKLSAVNSKQSLLTETIDKCWRTILRVSGKPEIARLTVDNDLADRNTINLLEHRMTEKMTIPRDSSLQELFAALNDAFVRREHEIIQRNSLKAKGA